jgi:SNF2 family DNA or RNA helicase
MRDALLTTLCVGWVSARRSKHCRSSLTFGSTRKARPFLCSFALLTRHIGALDPHLVICPLSVLASWEGECARWWPSARVSRLHGSAPERARFKSQPAVFQGLDILLTTYETYVAEASWLKSRRLATCRLN